MARGTIINRGTKEKPRYSVVIEAARDPVTGKRKQHWHSGFKRKPEAEEALTKLLRAIDTGQYVEPSKMTVKELVNDWLTATKDTIRDSTWQNYKANMDLHVIPNIGTVRVQRLTAANLNSLYKKLQTEGKKSQGRPRRRSETNVPTEKEEHKDEKKGLSAKTVRNIHAAISSALSYAVKNNLVARNVAAQANPPRCSRKEMRTWTAAELRAFLGGIKNERLYAAYVLAATTGMRRGEVVGLRWEDVDLEAGTLSVRETRISVNYVPQVSDPKTSKSRRSIAIDPHTVSALKTHRVKQAEERLAKGSDYRDSGYVFTTEVGEPIHPDLFSKHFVHLVKKSQLPEIRLHDLRHTWATLALCQGIHPKVVSERLGHSTIAMTLDTYSHAIPALQKEAADQLAALVFES